MKWNGRNYTKNYIDHNEMMKGGTMEIEMDTRPNERRGVSPEDLPYSFSNEKR